MSRSSRIISAALAVFPILAFAGALPGDGNAPDGAPPDGAAPGAPMHWHHHDMRGPGPMGEPGLMGVLGQLGLTPAQKEQIHGIMKDEHARMQSERQGEIADLPALGNPGDPGHAAAVQSAQKRAAERIQHRSDVEQQIYGVLTPAQQAQLPKLLAAMQQHMSQRLHHPEPPGN
ncbi:MAG TPA: Spy/CpxP family protein refolding chaperone [Steroidobacteraceae bacterium]|nr:Spy/CpxP family protein refolding chaperone [Steroidobacteraceae bacterium]